MENAFFFLFFFLRNKENVKSATIFTPSSLQINVTIYVINGFFLKEWLVNYLINECLKCVLVIGDTSICKIYVIKIATFIELLCILKDDILIYSTSWVKLCLVKFLLCCTQHKFYKGFITKIKNKKLIWMNMIINVLIAMSII